MSSFNYNAEEFLNLLFNEMNGLTKKEFARKCGITPESFSRFTRKNNPIRPGEITLRKISDNTNLDLDDLRRACGYAVYHDSGKNIPIERAKENIKAMQYGFSEMTSGIRLYDDIHSFLEEYDMIYSVEKAKTSYYVKDKEEYYGPKTAEYFSPICMTFEALMGKFCIYAVLYFCETKGGKIIVTDFSFDGKSLLEAGAITSDVQDQLYESGEKVEELPYYYTYHYVRTSSEKLLNALFHCELEEYPSAVSGFGFSLKSDYHFLSFLKNHKKSFCVGEEEQKLYDLCVNGEDPETVFADYKAPFTEYTGLGAVVAKIMCEETDMPFEWWIGERDSDSCILYTENAYTIEELKGIVYPYAKELGLSRYGECYVLNHDYIDKDCVFEIEQEDTDND